jgi:hypothetical protein
MAEILLVGRVPVTGEGKRFGLTQLDWWLDILHVLGLLLSDAFPVRLYFFSDSPSLPPTPHLSQCDAHALSRLVEKTLMTLDAETCLRNRYSTEPNIDEDGIARRLAHRLNLFRDFVLFLSASGGCHAQWDKPTEDKPLELERPGESQKQADGAGCGNVVDFNEKRHACAAVWSRSKNSSREKLRAVTSEASN